MEREAAERAKVQTARRKEERRRRVEARLKKKMAEQSAFKALKEVKDYLRGGSFCEFTNPLARRNKKSLKRHRQASLVDSMHIKEDD